MSTPMSAVTLAAQIRSKHSVYGAMQLQKLVYYSEVWAQVLGGSLFDDDIEAWEKGPVVRSVWVAEKSNTLPVEPEAPSKPYSDLLDAVISFYGNRGGADLSVQTHNEAPWIDAFRQGQNTEIPRHTLRNFYAKQAILEPEKVPPLPEIAIERPKLDVVEKRAEGISRKWERTLAILGS